MEAGAASMITHMALCNGDQQHKQQQRQILLLLWPLLPPQQQHRAEMLGILQRWQGMQWE